MSELDHTVLPATVPPSTDEHASSQAGTLLTYPGGMEGSVDLGGWLYTELVYLPPTVTPLSSNYLIAT